MTKKKPAVRSLKGYFTPQGALVTDLEKDVPFQRLIITATDRNGRMLEQHQMTGDTDKLKKWQRKMYLNINRRHVLPGLPDPHYIFSNWR